MIRLIVLLLLPIVTYAGPAGTVFKYECEQANKLNVGFICKGIDGRHLMINKTKKVVSPQKKKVSDYQFNKLILRYIELGGTYIHVTADFWPKNALRSCQATKNRTNYTCYDCKWVDKGDGHRTCELVN